MLIKHTKSESCNLVVALYNGAIETNSDVLGFSILYFCMNKLLSDDNSVFSRSSLDTGQYFKKGRPKVKNLKFGSFLRAPEDLEGLSSQKNSIQIFCYKLTAN